ncbi:hypothetical protein, partial [uncultured Lamprocystis sp.]|uniref:hypothetical protein n=1 Tax=uncultured Lamprocystis sp. TaxID=543132 RepID=UPI0025FAFB51
LFAHGGAAPGGWGESGSLWCPDDRPSRLQPDAAAPPAEASASGWGAPVTITGHWGGFIA